LDFKLGVLVAYLPSCAVQLLSPIHIIFCTWGPDFHQILYFANHILGVDTELTPTEQNHSF